MKRVLIVDTETTGLDHATDRCIEVAAILYSIEHVTVLESFSSLLAAPGNAAEHINRIPPAALLHAADPSCVWEWVSNLVEDGGAEAFIAHKAEFDHAFFPQKVRETRPWICSKTDLVWPKQTRPEQSLVTLALEHDLGVETAHRAMADCLLIARLLTRAHDLGASLPAMLLHGMRPKVLLEALVSYDERDLAKQAAFQWDGARRKWLRKMALADAATLKFRTQEVA